MKRKIYFFILGFLILIQSNKATKRKEISCKDFIKALNSLRTKPKSYSELIQKNWIANLVKNKHKINGHLYKEGIGGLFTTITWLSQIDPVPALKYNSELCKAAHYHSYVMKTQKKLGHVDEKNRGIRQWIKHFGKAERLGEAVSIVPDVWSKAEFILAEWLIDDSSFEKRNRKLLMSKNFDFAGYGGRMHEDGIFSSLVFAKGFVAHKKKGVVVDGFLRVLQGIGCLFLMILLKF